MDGSTLSRQTDDTRRDFATLRDEMVDTLIVYANLVSPKIGRPAVSRQVLQILRATPRHRFVPKSLQRAAYSDSPLPIGHGHTISQPFIVALMSSLLEVEPTDRVLEVGTGLGYQTAVLAHMAEQVFSVEIVEELACSADENLNELGINNVRIGVGDGTHGWPEYALFDKILLSTAPEMIPVDLLKQLRPGGKMVVPSGLADTQQLVLVQRDLQGAFTTTEIMPVQFCAMSHAS